MNVVRRFYLPLQTNKSAVIFCDSVTEVLSEDEIEYLVCNELADDWTDEDDDAMCDDN